MRRAAAALLIALGAALAGCSGGAQRAASATTASSGVTAPPSSAAHTTTTTTPTGAQNLVVTDQLRAQLVAAGSALDHLSASDFTGLRAGETYYAYDAATQTYWAGAGLSPSPNSTPAQIASQDDGAYTVFTRTGSGAWSAYAVGATGVEGGTCPTQVPADVLALWGWAPGSCRPRTIL